MLPNWTYAHQTKPQTNILLTRMQEMLKMSLQFVIDRVTMTSVVSTIYVQCCRRHVVGIIAECKREK